MDALSFSLCIAVCLWVAAASVQAQAPERSPTAQQDDALEEDQARAHYHTGTVAFSSGRFADALEEFSKAFRLSGRPKLHYNIAVAAERLRQDALALESFEAYLAEVPDAPERSQVEARIAVLRQALANANDPASGATTTATSPAAGDPTDSPATPVPEGHRADAPTTHPASFSADPAPRGRLSTGHWLAIGGSAVFAVTGGVLLTVALLDQRAVEGADDGVLLRDIEAAHDRAPFVSTLGGVMLGAGLAGAALTTLWIVIGGKDDAPVRAHVGPARVSFTGSF